jgi:hypothetical protein
MHVPYGAFFINKEFVFFIYSRYIRLLYIAPSGIAWFQNIYLTPSGF